MKITYLIIGLLCLAALFFIGYTVSAQSFKIILILTIGFIFSLLTIMNLETGLFLLIFVVPFTQQMTLVRYARLPIEIGTDDFLIILIIFSWLAGLARRKEPAFRKTSLDWPIVTYFAVCIFSFVGAYARSELTSILVGFLHLAKFFEYAAIYFIVVSVINNLGQVKKFLLMFFTVTGFIALVQFSAQIRWGHFSLSSPPVGSQRIALYLNTMHAFDSNAVLASYYLLFLSIVVAMLLDTSVSKGKAFLILFATMLSFAIFNNYSRSSYVGLVVSFFILAALKEKRFFLIIIALILFSPIYMQSAILERITLTIRSTQPLILDESSQIRLVLWRKMMPVILNNPILGYGYWITQSYLGFEAHSQYLAVLGETGILGLSAFCWLIIRMFKNAAILMKKSATLLLKNLGLGYIAGLAGILTSCFFSENLQSFRLVGTLWFVTGLVTSANRILSEKDDKLTVEDSRA